MRIAPSVRPGQVIIDDAWEPYQFAGHRSDQVLTPNPINPIQLSGGYFHLRPRLAVGTPGASDRGTRVEVERRSTTSPHLAPIGHSRTAAIRGGSDCGNGVDLLT